MTLQLLSLLPRARYRAYSRHRMPLLSLVPLPYDRIALGLTVARDLERSFRVNAEIAFARGTLTRGMRWRERIVLAGLIAAYMRDFDRAANWLGAGIARFRKRVVARCSSSGYFPQFVEWILGHEHQIASVEGWKDLLVKAQSEDDYEALLLHASLIVAALGLEAEVEALLPSLKSHALSSRKRIVLARIGKPAPEGEIFAQQEIWDRHPDHIREKVEANILGRVFAKRDPPAQFLTERELAWSAGEPEAAQFRADGFHPICLALNRLAASKPSEAVAALAPLIGASQARIAELDRRKGPTKVFIGGFGWTGSSAVFDFLRSYVGIEEMPGAGATRFLNEGADSEPMLHQGPAGLLALYSDCAMPGGRVSDATWRQFFRLYVLAGSYRDYPEYKTANANRNLMQKLGIGLYYSLLVRFIHEYALTFETSAPSHIVVDARKRTIRDLGERIVKALFPDDTATILFNNSINTDRIEAMELLGGRCVYISVNRNVLDQMAEQRRSNIFFNRSVVGFVWSKFQKLRAFRRGRRKLSNGATIRFYDIDFNEWVRNFNLRQKLLFDLSTGHPSPRRDSYFDATASEANIGIYRTILSAPEIAALRVARLVFRGV